MAAIQSRPPRRCCWARVPRPISSRNWKSSLMMSNAPMARLWATWMRTRCSICAPAAFRKPRPVGLLLHAFLEDAVAEIAAADQRELVRDRALDGAEGGGMTWARSPQLRLLKGPALTSEQARADFEILSRRGLWQAAGLSGLRRQRPEAEGRAGRDAGFRHQRICQCPSRRAFPLRRRHRPL